jgi:hypothetical protein
MRTQKIAALFAVACAGVWAGLAIAAPDFPAYSVTDLKALGIWPAVMNQKGEVVGQACCGRQSAGVLLYTSSQVWDIGLPAGGYSSFTPKALNESGWIVGDARSPSPPDPTYGQQYDAAFYNGDGWTVIDTSALGRTTNVVGINNAGQVIGNSGYYQYPGHSPWLYDRGKVIQLGPTSLSGSTATDINDAGEVAGYFGLANVFPSIWVYRDGEWQDLRHYGGSTSSINEAGTILVTVPHRAGVPGYAYILLDGVVRGIPTCDDSRNTYFAVALNNRDEVAGSGPSACLYSSGGSVRLGTLGGNSSGPHSLNNLTQVAGWSFDSQGRLRPFVYDDGVMLDVADLKGVGSALQLGKANNLQVTINDGPYLLVIATDTAADPDTLEAAYLLTPVAPTVTLTAVPSAVPVRTSVTLTWSSQNANSCVAIGGVAGDGWAGTRPTSGQATVTSTVVGTTQYSVVCAAGPLSSEGQMSVLYSAAPPVVRLAATPPQARVRNQITLAWTSEGADSCAATGGRAGDGWTGILATSGQRQVTEAKPGAVEYGVNCAAVGLASEARVSVTFKKKSGGGGLDVLSVILLGLGARRRKTN